MTADSADGSVNSSAGTVFAVNRSQRNVDVCDRTLEIIGGIGEVNRSIADTDLVNVPCPVVRGLLFVCGKSSFFFSFLRICFGLSLFVP